MKWFRRLLLVLVGLPWLTLASTSFFESDLTESEWRVGASVFECELIHGIPYYGQVVFSRRAGETQEFVLRSPAPSLTAGEVLFASYAPEWKKSGQGRHLGSVSVAADQQDLRLGERLSHRILGELHRGMQVVLVHPTRHEDQSLVQVGISAVNFRAAYNRYMGCLADLLPVNFQQIERTAIYFGDGEDAILPGELDKLDNIARYVEADDSVTRFYVDGHTDSRGSRLENFELSRQRAELIAAHLAYRGIPEESIVTRWHGERYPVASNDTAEGRAQNRRVTVRLVRGDEGPDGSDFAGSDELAQR